jgi:hypothetical protein
MLKRCWQRQWASLPGEEQRFITAAWANEVGDMLGNRATDPTDIWYTEHSHPIWYNANGPDFIAVKEVEVRYDREGV